MQDVAQEQVGEVAMSSSPWERTGEGNEDVAAQSLFSIGGGVGIRSIEAQVHTDSGAGSWDHWTPTSHLETGNRRIPAS